MRPTVASALYQPLDHILTSPALVRVSRVLASHGGSLGVSDIARRARLSLPSTRAAIGRLLESGVVTAVGAGRSMTCALRREHALAPALLALFAAERTQADAVLDGIRQAASTLSPSPLAVWLYGSVARGADQPTSDIDIALVSVLPEPGAQAEVFRAALETAVPQLADRVSVITLARSDVRRLARAKAGLWRELTRDAVVLAGVSPAAVIEEVTGPEVAD